MKKTLIICGTIVLVAIAVLVTVIILRSPPVSRVGAVKGDISKFAEEMTFEEFTAGMKDDLSDEVMAEVERIYEEIKNTQDEEEAGKLMRELFALEVFDKSNMGGKGGFIKEDPSKVTEE